MSYPKPGKGTDWTVVKDTDTQTQCEALCATKPKMMPKPSAELVLAVNEALKKLCIITDVYCNDDNQIVVERVIWDLIDCEWQPQCKVLDQKPNLINFKPMEDGDLNPELLPDFNDCIYGCDSNGEPVKIVGGAPVPSNLNGFVQFDVAAGIPCYIPGKPPAIIPEVQIGGAEPALDSGIKTWISNGIHKYPTENGWAQVNPYGSKS